MFCYPWTNLHELNLGWAMHKLKELPDDGDCVFVRPEEFPESENPVADAVQKAADDAKMVLLSGVYDVTETIYVPEGMTIIGTNNARLVSAQKNVTGFCPTTIFEMGPSTTVKNVTFDGNRPDGASLSITPSDLNPGETFERAPLVLLNDVAVVTFEGCIFTNYDSNRMAADSWQNAVIGAYQAYRINLKDCIMFNCRREGITFVNSGIITIDNFYFSMQNDPGDVYTEIGLLNTDDVNITNCWLIKADGVTTSAINAQGSRINIKGCFVHAPNSNYGIDYGNEIAADFSARDLLISECYLNCHISAATTYPVDHNNVKIINNTLDATDVTGSSGLIMVYGTNDNVFDIINNHFTGNFVSPVLHGIRTGQNMSIKISIVGNTFEAGAIRVSEDIPPMLIANNWFKDDAIYQATANATAQTLVFNGCTCTRVGRFGALGAGNEITVILVGCDFRRSVCTNAFAVDASLSYIRGV